MAQRPQLTQLAAEVQLESFLEAYKLFLTHLNQLEASGGTQMGPVGNRTRKPRGSRSILTLLHMAMRTLRDPRNLKPNSLSPNHHKLKPRWYIPTPLPIPALVQEHLSSLAMASHRCLSREHTAWANSPLPSQDSH